YNSDIKTMTDHKLTVSVPVTFAAAESPPPLSHFTVLQAIQLAGGLRETADIFHIRLKRASTDEEIKVDLWRCLVEGDSSQDVILRNGDTVFVPKGGAAYDVDVLGWAVNRVRPVRVIGEVQRPGLYYLGPGDDVVTMLAKAGGFNDIAKQRYVLLGRLNHDGTVTTRCVNYREMLRGHDRAGRASVRPGDILVVEASVWRRMAPTVGYIAGVAVVFSMVSVIAAAIPTTFSLSKLYTGNQNGTSNAAFALVGLGYGGIFGTRRNVNPSPQATP
ncbi:MAG: SLBB domain-containing protein, partial [Cyanobacteria bacterium]|nr:SLBB domain-containing protein [Cyanobacteriota bacterium]